MTPDQRIERSRRPFETADADEVVDLFTPGASCQSNVFASPTWAVMPSASTGSAAPDPARCHRLYGTARHYRRPRCGEVVDDDDRP